MANEKERVEIPIKMSFSEQDSFEAKFGEVKKISSSNYEELFNRPKIEGNELIGDKTFKQLGMDTLAVWEIEKILYLD